MSQSPAVANKPIVAPVPTAAPRGISRGVTFLLALTCATIAAGSYFAQPLLPVIGPELGLGDSAGLVVSLTQLGFCAGLILLAPLGDLVENRRLVLVTLCCSVVALALTALSTSATMLLVSSVLIGLAATSVQMLVPFAAHMAPPEQRGRVMGTVTSGLLFGALFARPVASSVTYQFGWRTLFAGASIAVALMALVLSRVLPRRQPQNTKGYFALLASLGGLLRTTRGLPPRALCQAMLFGAFSLFWTAVPFELVRHYGLTQRGIALFALAGAGGAFAALVAGRVADRGWGGVASGLAIAVVAASFGSMLHGGALWLLMGAAVLLDAGVQFNHVISQRALVASAGPLASRVNSLYVTTFIIGGAVGSGLSGWLGQQGWHAVATGGVSAGLAALILWFGFLRR